MNLTFFFNFYKLHKNANSRKITEKRKVLPALMCTCPFLVSGFWQLNIVVVAGMSR